MENYKELLLLSVSKQGENMKIHEIPFNIVLNGGLMIPYCFWTYERDDILEVLAIDGQEYGTKIIQKKNILYISLCYEDEGDEETYTDIMYN